MPPKKKAGGKKKKKGAKEEPEPIDVYTDMKGEELELTIASLREKLKDSQIKRNMLQIEKDMIHDFYHNTRDEIQELNARVTNFDTQMEKAEKNHRTDIISHMQKVKHLEYEHTQSQETVTKEAGRFMTTEHKYHADNENDMLKQKAQKKDDYTREDMNNIAEVDEKDKDLASTLADLQTAMELSKTSLIENYEIKMKRLAEELELRMKVEIHEIEERKNQHINELMLNHEISFRDMKEYYNSITRENIELIKMHREKLREIKAQIAANEQTVEQLRGEIDKMKIPLKQAEKMRDNLLRDLSTFDKDRMARRNAKGCLQDLKGRAKLVNEQRDELDRKFKELDADKEDMYKKFEIAIEQLRERANYKNEVLDEKLGVLQTEYERKELTLRELVQRSGLDQNTVDEICKKMEEAIEAKNSILRNLKYSLAHATKAYNDAIRVYEAKLVEFGIPADELGLEPLVTNTSTMPAGLVAA